MQKPAAPKREIRLRLTDREFGWLLAFLYTHYETAEDGPPDDIARDTVATYTEIRRQLVEQVTSATLDELQHKYEKRIASRLGID
jgi:hypothetical protein